MSGPARQVNVAQTSPERCAVCDKRVYATERLLVEGSVLHETCFRCARCKSKLTPNFSGSLEGKWYCKAHFTELSEERIAAAEAAQNEDSARIGGGLGAVFHGGAQ